jgi:protein-tyrosine phosphatase
MYLVNFKVFFFFNEILETCRKKNSNMLIHCLAGISRSPTLAIAYIMKHMNKSFDESYEYLSFSNSSYVLF